MYKEYYINGDLSYCEFTKKNTELEKYVSVMNPCCDINKNNGSSLEFLLCSFDSISKAFIGNGEIQVIFENRMPYVIYKGNKIKINNLHIHSKNTGLYL